MESGFTRGVYHIPKKVQAPLIGAWKALLVVGGGLVLISGVVALVSAGILKRMTLKPEQTMDTLEENKEWLKELT